MIKETEGVGVRRCGRRKIQEVAFAWRGPMGTCRGGPRARPRAASVPPNPSRQQALPPRASSMCFTSHDARCVLIFPRTKTNVQPEQQQNYQPDPHLSDGLRTQKLPRSDRWDPEPVFVATLMLFPRLTGEFSNYTHKNKTRKPDSSERGPRTIAETPKAASH